MAALRRIRAGCSATDEHFEAVYVETLRRWAAFAQELPASEAHHHAHRGGLLDHSLDVAARALMIRRQYLLPVGAPPEISARAADRWTYAAFAAALLHDAGKPATDQLIELHDAGGTKIGTWNSWAGPMPAGVRYDMRFRRARIYRRHQWAAAFLAPRFLPRTAMLWLGRDPEVMAAFIGALSGEEEAGGALCEIVELADRQSTASGHAGFAPAAPGATRNTLSVAVREAVRALVDKGELPINRPGAGAFVSGEYLWLVSKRGMDRIRAKLRETGAASVAPRNDHFMDDLQAQGIIVAKAGGRAIWRARITSAEGGFDQELTFLKLPLAAIWPPPLEPPAAFEGAVAPLTSDKAAAVEALADRAQSRRLHAPEADNDDPKNFSGRVPSDSEKQNAGEALRSNSDHASGVLNRDHPGSENGGSALSASVTSEPETEPEAFFAWLGRGVREGSLGVNNPRAQLHVVAEGLFLVSPLIFKAYAGEEGPWAAVQKKMIRAGNHIRTATGQNILQYRVEGKNSTSQLRGLVLKDPEALLAVKLPKLNTRLMRMSGI